MMKSSNVPISVKCRIGIDDMDSYAKLFHFIATVSGSGVKHFIVHARKALLGKFSPKENRTIPELNYEMVHQLIKDFPQLEFTLNGGITSYEQVQEHLRKGAVGVMIGRRSHKDPEMFSEADEIIFGVQSKERLSKFDVIHKYLKYAAQQQLQSETVGHKISTSTLLKPIVNYWRPSFPKGTLEQWRRLESIEQILIDFERHPLVILQNRSDLNASNRISMRANLAFRNV